MSIETFLKVGERTEFSKTIGEADLILFSGLTGDFDPIHVNEDFARTTAFGKRIAHGGLVMGLLSTTASMMSRRSIERGAQAVPVSLGYDRIRFLAPVYFGDTVTVDYRISAIDIERRRSTGDITIKNQDGTLVAVGTHILKWVRNT